jgi:hypothetical protein
MLRVGTLALALVNHADVSLPNLGMALAYPIASVLLTPVVAIVSIPVIALSCSV